MTWKDYEREILTYFKGQYPNTEISHNVFVEGRFSRSKRQIDLLIEGHVGGNRIRIIVDGKYFSKKIDVKHVEMFIGMLNDCEANKGLLITQEGYSKAAINRAYYEPIDIELDILNFKNLHEHQGFFGVLQNGGYDVVMSPPFGWVIDISKQDEYFLVLYQRGYTFEQARKANEWIVTRITGKTEAIKCIDDLINEQSSSSVRVNYLTTIKRDDAKTKLTFVEKDDGLREYIGYVEFADFIFYCTLCTPQELHKKNLRKLESIMEQILPFSAFMKIFEWDIQTEEKGSLMFLDVPFNKDGINDDETSFEYLTLCVAKDNDKSRPDFISVMLPNDIDAKAELSISFARNAIDEERGHSIVVEKGHYYEIGFEDVNDDFVTARMNNGYINGSDIFQNFIDFDQVVFLFSYPDQTNKMILVPLFSFREQYKKLG